MIRNFPFYHQLDAMDCGATCLRMIARHYGRYYSLEYLRDLTHMGKQGVSLLEISDAAEEIGMQTLAAKTTFDRLQEDIPLPYIVHWEEDHFVVVYGLNDKYVWIADPGDKKVKLKKEDFLRSWISEEGETEEDALGIILMLEPTPEFYDRDGDGIDKSKWGYVFSYFKKHSALLIQMLAGLIFGAVFSVAVPFLIKSLVDIGIGHVEPNFVQMIILGLVFLFVAQTFIELLRRWILLHVSVRVNVNLMSDFLIKLTRLPLRFFDSRMTGDLMQRIADHERVQRFLTSTSLFSFLSLINFLAFSVILAFWSGAVFAVFFVGTILNLLWVIIFQARKRDLDYKSFDQAAENQSNLIELVNGMQEIKLHNAEKQKRWAWERSQAKLIRTGIDSLAIDQIQQTGGDVINEGKNLLIIFLVANAVLLGDMTIGMLAAILYIVVQMNTPIRQFVDFMRAFQEAKISLERMNEIHSKQDEENIAEKITMLPETGDLIMEHVSFQYDGPNSPLALDDLSIRIPKGKITAIVGSSGSGKSTIIKLLLNIYKPVDGKVRVGDINLTNVQQKLWRSKCGSVLQEGYIFNDTIAKNIALGDEIIDRIQLFKAVKAANIQSFVESLPLGYSTKIGKEGIGLSQGERQKILIARALYRNPAYLFFDEATTALDSYSEMLIMENLQEEYAGRTMVLVAHRLNTVQMADYIIVVEAGEIIEEGTHEALYYSRGAYYQLLRNQIELGA